MFTCVKILKKIICIFIGFMALLKVICWAIIFIARIRFPPGQSLAMISLYAYALYLYCLGNETYFRSVLLPTRFHTWFEFALAYLPLDFSFAVLFQSVLFFFVIFKSGKKF